MHASAVESVTVLTFCSNMPTPLASTSTASAPLVTTCPQCGILGKTGKISCCALGGAWFKKCGNPGDSTFDHTWSEGIEACQGEVETE